MKPRADSAAVFLGARLYFSVPVYCDDLTTTSDALSLARKTAIQQRPVG